MRRTVQYITAGLLLTASASCVRQTRYYEESGNVFHTLYHIKYQAPGLLTDKIDAELQAVSLSLNPFHPQSIISRVNRNEDVDVDERFAVVFNRAMEVSENSGGFFDATVAPLINIWGFGFEKGDSVTQPKIDSIKCFVGYKKIRLEGRKVVKDDPRVTLNFSAIAKGYASDAIAALFEREGVENYMVEIGGEVAAKGKNPNGDCWQIGIDKPDDDVDGIRNDIERIVRLCDKCGMATSGNYRNYYVRDGRKYAHTIDPYSGYPSGHTILSATVIAPDCMTADAYATACMAMGVDAAVRMAENIPEIACYIIYTDHATGAYRVHSSASMSARLK